VNVRNHKLLERYGLHNQDLYCNRALYYLINNLLKMLTQKPCIVPMTSFISSNGKNSVGCMYKSNQGLLFPLKNQFIFVPKPTLSIPYEQVSAVTCVRGQGNVASAGNRFFDVTVVVDSSAGTRSAFEFQHLERSDLNPLFKILKQNGVECPDFVAPEAEKKKGEIDASQIHHLDDDEDDEDWQAGADEDSADSDLSASDDEAPLPGGAPPAKRRRRG
jgi:structure-specific recognition protein 1